jgi:uncharacterized protein (DUF1330 family)
MSAYVIFNYDIQNSELWSTYAQSAVPNLMAAGGKLLTATHEFETVEGQPQQVIVVIEFESMAAAKAWYTSASYQAIMPMRAESTKGWVLIAPEFTLPTA